MQPTSTSWDDLRFFLAVQRVGSHKRAARSLRVAHTTVGRRLAALEAALGTRLFDRLGGELVLTEVGRQLLPHAERVQAEIDEAEREVRGADRRLQGTVRVTAGDGLIHYVLVPALGVLRRRHPGITVELRADTRELDLSRREADVAIRLSRPKEPRLVARRLGDVGFGLYAGAEYLTRRGTPRSIADLGAHDLVGFDASLDELPQVRWLRRAMAPATPRWVLRASSTTAQVLACSESLGVALLGTFVDGAVPGLVRVLPRAETPSRPLWLVVHEDMRPNARVAAVSAWLAETLEARAAPRG